MPLGESDVLDTLSDPVTLGLNFWVGPIHISGTSYGVIRDHIRAGNILVASGTGGLAFYDNKTDILTTQAGTSPANLGDRAQLLHECTHALIDVFGHGLSISRHTDELASYIAQLVYQMRSDSNFVVGPNNAPWFSFFSSVVAVIKTSGLDTLAGNGQRISMNFLEPLRVQLATLPYVNYGTFGRNQSTGADGLMKTNPFLDGVRGEIAVHHAIASREIYPDPSDDYLVRTLQERYVASDVAGYGKRLRSLRGDFAFCSLRRAKELSQRLTARRGRDRVSELFHDRLSTAGRAILLRVLRNRG